MCTPLVGISGRTRVMRTWAIAVLIVAMMLFLVAPTWAQEFAAWEGKEKVYEGEGGTRKTVDGIDFWSDGSPPRKFVLIGYITDRRHKTGLLGAMRMSRLESDVARVAREAGADAVILLSAEDETTGRIGTGFTPPGGGNSWGSATDIKKQNTRFAAVRYVKEVETVPP